MEEDEPLTDKGRYRRLVGKLIYISHTRPDSGFIVGIVSRYMNRPIGKHLEVVFGILQYLEKNPGRGLFFKKSTKGVVVVFADADWAGSLTDRRSTTGYYTFFGGKRVTVK